MTNVELADWSLPPEERRQKMSNETRVYESIKERGVTYPNEIMEDTAMGRQVIYDHLRILKGKGKIEKIVFGEYPPDDVKARLPDLWAQGIKGGAIRRMSWYRLIKDNGDEKDAKKAKKL